MPGLVASGGDGGGGDVDAAAGFVEFHLAVSEREEGPVAARSDVVSSDEFGAALTDDDAAGGDVFATEGFHAEALAVAVTAVTAAALSFFVSHKVRGFRV